MSFNFEFVSSREDADVILTEEHAPESVKEILRLGLLAFKPGTLVRVKAVGHIFNNDYQRSNVDLLTEQVTLRTPKAQGS
jgi:hypothetical protein